MVADAPLILVVDDDSDFLIITRHILVNAGYRVVCRHDAAEATQYITGAAAEELPDLIVTDLMMDTLQAGFEFAAWVKGNERTGGVPVVLVTAAASTRGFDFNPKAIVDFRAMHIDAYFDKPVPSKKLVDTVAILLRQQREVVDA